MHIHKISCYNVTIIIQIYELGKVRERVNCYHSFEINVLYGFEN
jgi:hypothetical protein